MVTDVMDGGGRLYWRLDDSCGDVCAGYWVPFLMVAGPRLVMAVLFMVADVTSGVTLFGSMQ